MSSAHYLSLFIGPGHPSPAAKDLMEALTTVEVQQSTRGQSGCQLTFSVSKSSRINRVLLPAGFFDPKLCRVRLVVTVGARATPVFEGVVAQQDLTPANEAGRSTLVLTCLDLTALMDFVDVTGTPLPPIPSYAAVALVLAPYASLGIIPTIVPTPFDFIPNVLEDIRVRTGTDLAFIQSLARRVGYVFYLSPGPAVGTSTAYWGPEVRAGIPQPALRINMDADSNVESLSFTYDGRANYVPVLWQLAGPMKVPAPVPIPGPPHLPLGARPATKDRLEIIEGATRLRPAEVALAAFKEASAIPDAITGSVQLDMTRYRHVLKAGGIVGVQGAGITYDGFYYVDSVTHTIQRGQYKQSGSLRRNHLVANTPRVSP
jgi:hypothetical protein